MKYCVEFLAPFLLEAVEASLCYFFLNWMIKLKFPKLLNPLGIKIQKNYESFYPSELIYFAYFNMRHPVQCMYVYQQLDDRAVI